MNINTIPPMFTNWAVVYYGYEHRAVHLDVELLISVLRIVDINNWEQVLIPLAIGVIVAAIVAATDRRDDRLVRTSLCSVNVVVAFNEFDYDGLLSPRLTCQHCARPGVNGP